MLKCPECNYTHTSPQQLGRHRQAVHGIVGRHNPKLKKHKLAKMPCDICHKTFGGLVGVATHKRKAHPVTAAPTVDGIAVDGVASTVAIATVEPKRKYNKSKKEVTNALTFEPRELYAYVAAKLESILARVAFEHDLPERQFAQGFSQYLLRP